MNPPEASIHELWVKDVGLARTRDVACRVRGGRSSAARSGNNASAAQHLLALDGRSPRLNSRGNLAESRRLVMSQVKRDLEEHEDRLAIIERLGIEEGALVLDEDADEVSSADDEQANKDFYARAFKEWAAGNISGDAEDIFDAVTSAIESLTFPTLLGGRYSKPVPA